MTLSHFHGLWLPLGKGMLIHSIYLPGCKVISTKSRCPCVIEFEVIGKNNQSKQNTQYSHFDLPFTPLSNQSSFLHWISQYLPFHHLFQYEEKISPKHDDSYLIVSSTPHTSSLSHYKVIIKTRDTIRQEEMISHVLHEVFISVFFSIDTFYSKKWKNTDYSSLLWCCCFLRSWRNHWVSFWLFIFSWY